MSVFDIVAWLLAANQVTGGRALQDRVVELLTMVGLEREHWGRYPHAFSDCQRQRIGIARALAPNPRIIIADEPKSSLDVSIQAQIIALLKDFQERLGLSRPSITHDLRVVHHVCERVAVMYAGQIVEMASPAKAFEIPSHPYQAVSILAVPKILVDRVPLK